MESKEKRNWAYIQSIFIEVVQKKLAEFFIQKWNKQPYGVWDGKSSSGQKLFNLELSRARPHILPKFQNGDTNSWDCTTLFDAILYSNAIGNDFKMREKKIWDAVYDLHEVRNIITHEKQGNLSDKDFQDFVNKIEKSFQVLKFPQTEIDEIKTKRNSFNSFQVLPCKPNHFVVERIELRKKIIKQLEKLRTDNNNELTYFFISGIPGSGKSELARQVCYEIYNSSDRKNEAIFVMTLDGKDLNSLLRSYRNFCFKLNCDQNLLNTIINETNSSEVKIRKLWSLLSPRLRFWQRWWIIVDNVVQLSEIHCFLPTAGGYESKNGQILLTVQDKDAVHPKEEHISVNHGMNDDECRQLLSHYNYDKAIDLLFDEISCKLDRQPLALSAAGYYVSNVIEANPNFTWKQYLGKLASGEQETMDECLLKVNPAYSQTILRAVVMAVKHNAQKSQLLAKVFYLFSLVSYDSMPCDIIFKYVQIIGLLESSEDIYTGLKNCSLFLYSNDDDDIRLHRIVHEAIIVYQYEHTHKQSLLDSSYACYVSTNAYSQVALALYTFKDRKDQIKLTPHLEQFLNSSMEKIKIDLGIANIFMFFASTLRFFGKLNVAIKLVRKIKTETGKSKPLVKAWCLKQLSELFIDIGKYDEAKKFCEEALDLPVESLGPNHTHLTWSLNNLGWVYCCTGDYDRAKKICEKALEINEKSFGSNHSTVADSLNNLGFVHNETGDFKKAKDYFKKSLKIKALRSNSDNISPGELEKVEDYFEKALKSKVLGSNHDDVAKCFNNLGVAYQEIGEYEEANYYHERALEIKRKSFGTDHPDVAISLNNLGKLCSELGELEKAKNYYEEALEIERKSLDSNDANVAKLLNNLGALCRQTGDCKKAKEYHEKALEIKKKSFGTDHLHVAISLNNLGNLCRETGDLKKAKVYYEESLEIKRKSLDLDHIEVAASLHNLGDLYLETGVYELARNYLEKSLDIYRKSLGQNHTDVARSLISLGNVHLQTREYEKSKDCFEKALKIQKQSLGPDHPDFANSLHNLGVLYRQTGDYQKAKDYHEIALEIKRKSLGQDHPDVAEYLKNLSVVYCQTEEFEKAKVCLEEALEIKRKLLGSDHPDLAKSLNCLGIVYYNFGEYDKAKDCYEKALEIKKKSLGPDHPDVAESLNNLGVLHCKIGEYEKVKNYYEEALDIKIKSLVLNHPDVANSLNNLGVLYCQTGAFEKAKNYYEDALEIKRNSLGPDHPDVAKSLEVLLLCNVALESLKN